METSHTKQHAFIEERCTEAESLSPAMWELLFDLSKGVNRGSLATRRALIRRGLIDHLSLTDKGRRFLTVQWRDAE